MTLFRLMGANIETPHDSPTARAELPRLMKEHEPDAVGALQAYHDHDLLLQIGRDLGYRLRQYQGEESRGIAVLVREDVRILHRRAIQMSERWTGPKAGLPHPPRTFPSLRLGKNDDELRTLWAHLPTFNNPKAQTESLTAIEKWLANPGVVLGDWNREEHQLAVLAAATGAQVLSPGRTKVDHAVAKGVRDVTAVRLPTPKGCHGWGLYDVHV